MSEALLEAIAVRDGVRDPSTDGTSPVFRPSLAAGLFKSEVEKAQPLPADPDPDPEARQARFKGEDPHQGRDLVSTLQEAGKLSTPTIAASSIPSARPAHQAYPYP